MEKRIRVALLFGGRSAEHEVSLQSARNILNVLDRDKYEPVLIGIDRQGRWYINENSIPLLNSDDPKLIQLNMGSREVVLTPNGDDNQLMDIRTGHSLDKIDVIFPVLHGPYGEDGSVQGLAKLANLPCVGAGILGSVIGMDKDIMKRLLKAAEISVASYLLMEEDEPEKYSFSDAERLLGMPVFVKPANLGSSVGISRVTNKDEYEKAVKTAFTFDLKIIIEENISGREIECSVLGNQHPIASVPGEIKPNKSFYSYEAKYIDENGAVLDIPAQLSPEKTGEIQKIAVETYKTLCCSGMARVDMFLTPEGDIVVNEINTIPGFTSISMYPKLWEYSGISNTELIDRLITLAFEDFEKRNRLKTTPDIE
ncbi:MAG: D-alanine--D-alanine ligase [Spirochaetales bacterium]|nr:D-alanine--D-alanine ligase [Spirochaetales bacterium]